MNPGAPEGLVVSATSDTLMLLFNETYLFN